MIKTCPDICNKVIYHQFIIINVVFWHDINLIFFPICNLLATWGSTGNQLFIFLGGEYCIWFNQSSQISVWMMVEVSPRDSCFNMYRCVLLRKGIMLPMLYFTLICLQLILILSPVPLTVFLSNSKFTICTVYWSLGHWGYFGVSNVVLVIKIQVKQTLMRFELWAH